LPTNRFILSIHDLTKTDLKNLDDLMHRYFKSWLGMPQSGFGMDVKSGSHLYKESRPLDIVRALMRGDITVQTTVRAKVQREQEWTRKSAISVCAAEIVGTILSYKEPVIGNAAVVEPPLAIHDTEPQDPQPPQAQGPLYAHPGDLNLPTRTQLWNQAHNCGKLSPFQHKLTLSQKCWPSGRRSGECFVRKRMMHGLLASAALPFKETSLLSCRLRVRASLGSRTCGIFLMVF
jgi:hypothetical protein